MTEDYKKQLLNYVTGNVETTSQNNIIDIKNKSESQFLLEQQIVNELQLTVNPYITIYEFLTTKDSDGNELPLSICYGSFYYDDAVDIRDIKSFIAVIDKNFELVKLFTSYESTQTRFLSKLQLAENGTLYGIDCTINNSGKHLNNRFIMLNNPTQIINGEYQLDLKYSVYFPNDILNFNYDKIYLNKHPNESKYLIGLLCVETTGKFVELVVNVGSENTWNIYNAPSSYYTFEDDIFSYWSSENLYIRILSVYADKIYFHTLDGTTFTRTTITTLNDNNRNDYSKLTTYDTFILASITYNEDMTPSKYKVYYYDTTFELVYSENLSNAELYQTFFKKIGTVIYSFLMKYESVEKPNAGLYMYIINGSNVSKITLDESGNYGINVVDKLTLIKNEFNLNTFYLIKSEYDNYLTFKIIYNSNQYNGEEYTDYNSIIPKQATIYNNSSLVFARNLYNFTINANQSNATVVVPNSYLNNIELTNQTLLSETNTDLISNDETITKNIYETLFINFINTINVIDEDTQTTYPDIATYINSNINTGTQTSYENSACTKYRINYTDTTTSISTLEWLPINEYNKTTRITFYADKNISSIDLISEDETTVYLNIPVEVEIGKTYTIKQKVRTGDKLTPVQLQYNNENINYNNEPVMVYIEEVNNGS